MLDTPGHSCGAGNGWAYGDVYHNMGKRGGPQQKKRKRARTLTGGPGFKAFRQKEENSDFPFN